jgi:tRNA(Arg) A34 adenosine deaminase TadA
MDIDAINADPSRRPRGDSAWMQLALELADRAAGEGDEVPVGALLVAHDGRLLAAGTNRAIATNDPTAHAEIIALRAAGQRLGNYRLDGGTLYVTLEPCAMCAAALVHARIARLVYGAANPKAGACGSVFDILRDPHHNHRVIVDGGVLAEEAGARLSEWFRARRAARPR